MRTTRLLAALLPFLALGACATGSKTGGTGDDDDTTTHSGTTTTSGAGGTAPTTTDTTSTTGTDTTTTSSTSSTTTSTGTPSCYAGHGDCDPLQTSCGAGETCDVDSGTNTFVCYPPPNTAGLGSPCDVSAGPYCMNGLTCVSDGTSSTCAAYCCTAAECGAGTCTSLGMSGSIEVKVCTP